MSAGFSYEELERMRAARFRADAITDAANIDDSATPTTTELALLNEAMRRDPDRFTEKFRSAQQRYWDAADIRAEANYRQFGIDTSTANTLSPTQAFISEVMGAGVYGDAVNYARESILPKRFNDWFDRTTDTPFLSPVGYATGLLTGEKSFSDIPGDMFNPILGGLEAVGANINWLSRPGALATTLPGVRDVFFPDRGGHGFEWTKTENGWSLHNSLIKRQNEEAIRRWDEGGRMGPAPELRDPRIDSMMEGDVTEGALDLMDLRNPGAREKISKVPGLKTLYQVGYGAAVDPTMLLMGIGGTAKHVLGRQVGHTLTGQLPRFMPDNRVTRGINEAAQAFGSKLGYRKIADDFAALDLPAREMKLIQSGFSNADAARLARDPVKAVQAMYEGLSRHDNLIKQMLDMDIHGNKNLRALIAGEANAVRAGDQIALSNANAHMGKFIARHLERLRSPEEIGSSILDRPDVREMLAARTERIEVETGFNDLLYDEARQVVSGEADEISASMRQDEASNTVDTILGKARARRQAEEVEEAMRVDESGRPIRQAMELDEELHGIRATLRGKDWEQEGVADDLSALLKAKKASENIAPPREVTVSGGDSPIPMSTARVSVAREAADLGGELEFAAKVDTDAVAAKLAEDYANAEVIRGGGPPMTPNEIIQREIDIGKFMADVGVSRRFAAPLYELNRAMGNLMDGMAVTMNADGTGTGTILMKNGDAIDIHLVDRIEVTESVEQIMATYGKSEEQAIRSIESGAAGKFDHKVATVKDAQGNERKISVEQALYLSGNARPTTAIHEMSHYLEAADLVDPTTMARLRAEYADLKNVSDVAKGVLKYPDELADLKDETGRKVSVISRLNRNRTASTGKTDKSTLASKVGSFSEYFAYRMEFFDDSLTGRIRDYFDNILRASTGIAETNHSWLRRTSKAIVGMSDTGRVDSSLRALRKGDLKKATKIAVADVADNTRKRAREADQRRRAEPPQQDAEPRTTVSSGAQQATFREVLADRLKQADQLPSLGKQYGGQQSGKVMDHLRSLPDDQRFTAQEAASHLELGGSNIDAGARIARDTARKYGLGAKNSQGRWEFSRDDLIKIHEAFTAVNLERNQRLLAEQRLLASLSDELGLPRDLNHVDDVRDAGLQKPFSARLQSVRMRPGLSRRTAQALNDASVSGQGATEMDALGLPKLPDGVKTSGVDLSSELSERTLSDLNKSALSRPDADSFEIFNLIEESRQNRRALGEKVPAWFERRIAEGNLEGLFRTDQKALLSAVDLHVPDDGHALEIINNMAPDDWFNSLEAQEALDLIKGLKAVGKRGSNAKIKPRSTADTVVLDLVGPDDLERARLEVGSGKYSIDLEDDIGFDPMREEIMGNDVGGEHLGKILRLGKNETIDDADVRGMREIYFGDESTPYKVPLHEVTLEQVKDRIPKGYWRGTFHRALSEMGLDYEKLKGAKGIDEEVAMNLVRKMTEIDSRSSGPVRDIFINGSKLPLEITPNDIRAKTPTAFGKEIFDRAIKNLGRSYESLGVDPDLRGQFVMDLMREIHLTQMDSDVELAQLLIRYPESVKMSPKAMKVRIRDLVSRAQDMDPESMIHWWSETSVDAPDYDKIMRGYTEASFMDDGPERTEAMRSSMKELSDFFEKFQGESVWRVAMREHNKEVDLITDNLIKGISERNPNALSDLKGYTRAAAIRLPEPFGKLSRRDPGFKMEQEAEAIIALAESANPDRRAAFKFLRELDGTDIIDEASDRFSSNIPAASLKHRDPDGVLNWLDKAGKTREINAGSGTGTGSMDLGGRLYDESRFTDPDVYKKEMGVLHGPVVDKKTILSDKARPKSEFNLLDPDVYKKELDRLNASVVDKKTILIGQSRATKKKFDDLMRDSRAREDLIEYTRLFGFGSQSPHRADMVTEFLAGLDHDRMIRLIRSLDRDPSILENLPKWHPDYLGARRELHKAGVGSPRLDAVEDEIDALSMVAEKKSSDKVIRNIESRLKTAERYAKGVDSIASRVSKLEDTLAQMKANTRVKNPSRIRKLENTLEAARKALRDARVSKAKIEGVESLKERLKAIEEVSPNSKEAAELKATIEAAKGSKAQGIHERGLRGVLKQKLKEHGTKRDLTEDRARVLGRRVKGREGTKAQQEAAGEALGDTRPTEYGKPVSKRKGTEHLKYGDLWDSAIEGEVTYLRASYESGYVSDALEEARGLPVQALRSIMDKLGVNKATNRLAREFAAEGVPKWFNDRRSDFGQSGDFDAVDEVLWHFDNASADEIKELLIPHVFEGLAKRAPSENIAPSIISSIDAPVRGIPITKRFKDLLEERYRGVRGRVVMPNRRDPSLAGKPKLQEYTPSQYSLDLNDDFSEFRKLTPIRNPKKRKVLEGAVSAIMNPSGAKGHVGTALDRFITSVVDRDHSFWGKMERFAGWSRDINTRTKVSGYVARRDIEILSDAIDGVADRTIESALNGHLTADMHVYVAGEMTSNGHYTLVKKKVDEVESGEGIGIKWVLENVTSQDELDFAMNLQLLKYFDAQLEKGVDIFSRGGKIMYGPARPRKSAGGTYPEFDEFGNPYPIDGEGLPFIRDKRGPRRMTRVEKNLRKSIEVAEARGMLDNVDRMAKAEDVIKRLQAFGRANLKYAVDKGLISEAAARKAVRDNGTYLDIGALSNKYGIDNTAILDSYAGIKPWGIDADIGVQNPIINAIATSRAIMEASDRNELAREVLDAASGGRYQGGRQTGLARRLEVKEVIDADGNHAGYKIPSSDDPVPGYEEASKLRGRTPMEMDSLELDLKDVKDQAQNIIKVMENGEAVFYKVDDPDVLEDVARVKDGVPLPKDDWMHKALMLPAKATRYLVTTHPAFVVRNMERDTVSRLLLSEDSSILESIKQTGATLFSKENRAKGLRELRLSGGSQEMAGGLRGPEDWQQRVAAEMKKDGKSAFLSMDDATRIFGRWEEFMGRPEQWGRVSEYNAAKANFEKMFPDATEADKILYAGFRARGILNYARVGRSMEQIRRYIPFLNASIQGTHRFIKSLRAGQWQTSLAKFAGSVLAAEAIVWGLNRSMGNGEEYDQLPDYQKDMFWNIKVADDMWVKIAKPFEQGVLGSGLGRALSAAFGEHGWRKSFLGDKNAWMDGWIGSIRASMLPVDEGVFAGPYKGIAEQVMNYDMFRGRHIVNPHEADLDVKLRSGHHHASTIGKNIGDAFGYLHEDLRIDGRRVDHVLRSTGFSWARTFMDLSDVGNKEKPSPLARVATLGMTSTSPGANSLTAGMVRSEASRLGIQNNRLIQRFKALQRETFRPGATREEADEAKRQLRNFSVKVLKRMDNSDYEIRALRKAKERRNRELKRAGLPYE